jgi:deoxyribodipyrimidine photolyase
MCRRLHLHRVACRSIEEVGDESSGVAAARFGRPRFADTLVDSDRASNTLGWQWVAGCGTDAAPDYRIFNPHRQASTFDPEGRYLERWLYRRELAPPSERTEQGSEASS